MRLPAKELLTKRKLLFLLIAVLLTSAFLAYWSGSWSDSDGENREIEILPSPGQYLTTKSYINNQTKIRLLSLTKELTKIKEGVFYISQVGNNPPEKVYLVKPDEQVILLKGKIRNEYDEEYYVFLFAAAYDPSGREISESINAGAPGTPWSKGVVVKLEAGGETNFELILKYDSRISLVRIFVALSKSPYP